jgi:hypothetical protein
MRLFSFYPQASDVGKTHRFAPTTATFKLDDEIRLAEEKFNSVNEEEARGKIYLAMEPDVRQDRYQCRCDTEP